MARKTHKFKTGNICRVYIKDFLTFDEVEIWPRPRLNLIYGANGTGKSSILCAICICLGGRPSVTGRGKEVYDFVKRDKVEAVVEVEIHVEGEINVVVKRKMNKEKKHCSWWLQGKETKAGKVLERIAQLNIQVDNLCQFLPQDRVVEFARLNNQELLLATQQAVGDASLAEQHKVLCDGGQHLTRYTAMCDDLKVKLADAERKKAWLQKVVENLEVKEKLQEDIKRLQKQHVWYLYHDKRKKHLQHKERLKVKEREVGELKRQLEPFTRKMEEKKSQLHKIKKIVKEKAETFRRAQTASQRSQQEYDNLGDSVQGVRRAYQEMCQEEAQRKSEVLDYKRQLDVLLGQLQNLPALNEDESSQRLRQLTQKIQSSSQGIVQLQGKASMISGTRDDKARTVKAYLRELKEKEDIMGQRLELLREKNPDVYKAAKWLENNKEKFTGVVHPPLYTMLDITNEKYSSYVENRVMLRDLVAFVCECKEDVNVLKEEMDRQRLRVNIIFSAPCDLYKFRPPQPIQNLRKFGFTTYMVDVISAPPAILAFLCRSYTVHQVPISEGVSANYSAVPPSVTVFYMGTNRYSSSRSRYDGVVSTSIYPVRPPHLLRITQDKERIDYLKMQTANLSAIMKEEEETLQGLKSEEQELSRHLEELRNEKRALASRKEERMMLDQRIDQKRKQIERHELNVIDLDLERQKMEEKCEELTAQQVSLTVRQGISLKGVSEVICEGLRMEGKVCVLSKDLTNMEESIQEHKIKLTDLERESHAVKEEVERSKCEGQKALKELLQLLGLNNIQQITEQIREPFQNSSLEETEKLLAEKEAHLACLVTATTNELMEYRQRQKEVKTLTKQLEEAERKFENYQTNVEEMKKRWLPRINTLAHNISHKFSEFMSRLGCAGEVQLKADEGGNYAKYGMVIKVKFRDQQRLQELTPYVQSGGERAVSTALYLLALQSLTSAPFRCVDEINQGMDPVNERQFLKMLMETEGKENSSQYFFVSPKMLMDLTYSPGVNVMLVASSSTNLPHRKNNVKRAIKKRTDLNKRLGLVN